MYVGRIVAVARTTEGSNAGLYRVSSRSFPNRTAVDNAGRLAISKLLVGDGKKVSGAESGLAEGARLALRAAS